MGIFDRFTRQQPTEQADPIRKEPTVGRAYRPRLNHRFLQAGTQDGTTTKWGGTPLTADEIIRRHQRVTVARSREQAANNDYGRAFLRLVRTNIVGPYGVTLQARSRDTGGALDKAANDAIEAAFGLWGHRDNCDVAGTMSWRQLQIMAAEHAARDGEFMFRKIYGADAGPWGFALQALDPVRCPVDYDRTSLENGAFIRHGIEFNRYGRPLAFHFASTAEDEDYYTWAGRNYIRVPASEIIHGFRKDLGAGQKRGLPWMFSALYRMHHLLGFENAAVMNARAGASKMGFIEWDEGMGPECEEGDEVTIDAEPLHFQELPSGARFKEYSPQYPNGEFGLFNKAMLRGVAAGLGASYNTLAQDLEGVNFSSIRQGTLDERENWKDLQEWLIEQLVQPVFEAWLSYSLLTGKIMVGRRPLPATKLEKYREVTFQGRRWAWIDPRADVAASVEAKNNMLASPSSIIREQGKDPDTVWRELAADIEAMRAAGIPDEFIRMSLGEKLTNPVGRPPADAEPAA